MLYWEREAMWQDAQFSLRRMQEIDIDAIYRIEREVYAFPWSQAVFAGCFGSNYCNWVLQADEKIVAYAILTMAAGEAHLLNISVDAAQQGKGLGRVLLRELVAMLEADGIESLFLEVRPSNPVAIALYKSMGFVEIGWRKNYYPAHDGAREAAVVLQLML
jgi:[ribosomal protein S18]-alanine N-acetyltransferase